MFFSVAYVFHNSHLESRIFQPSNGIVANDTRVTINMFVTYAARLRVVQIYLIGDTNTTTALIITITQ